MKQFTLPSIKKIEFFVQNTPGAISFSQGAIRLGGVPQEAREFLATILETDRVDYYGPAAGTTSLKTALAQHFEPLMPSITEKNILISHGSIGALGMLCLKFLMPHDTVIVPTPAYPVYNNVIKASAAEPILLDAYHFDTTTKTWSLDLEKIEQAIDPSTKMLIISNPSNPLGLFLQKQEFETLIALAEKHNFLLVIDEAYDSFLFEPNFISSMKYVTESKQVVRLGSFSKNGAMSGWRIGYAIADPEIIEALIPVQDAMLCCPSMSGQLLAEYIIKHPRIMHEQQKKLHHAYQTTLNFFKTLAVDFQAPQGGFYFFFKPHNEAIQNFSDELLKKQKVGVVPGSDFSAGADRWIRLCFARENRLLLDGLERIKQFLAGYQETKTETKQSQTTP